MPSRDEVVRVYRVPGNLPYVGRVGRAPLRWQAVAVTFLAIPLLFELLHPRREPLYLGLFAVAFAACCGFAVRFRPGRPIVGADANGVYALRPLPWPRGQFVGWNRLDSVQGSARGVWIQYRDEDGRAVLPVPSGLLGTKPDDVVQALEQQRQRVRDSAEN